MTEITVLNNAGLLVANTYELLENILLHVPRYWNKDIIRAKMTSKSFAAVISRSKNIQKRLLIDLPADDTSVGTMLWAPNFFQEIVTMRYKSRQNRLHVRASIDMERLRSLEVPLDPTGSWRDLWLVRESTKCITVQGNLWCDPAMTAMNFRMSFTRPGGITLGHVADLAIELDDLVKFRKGMEIGRFGFVLSKIDEEFLRQDDVRIGYYMTFETFLDDDGSSYDSEAYYAERTDHAKEDKQRPYGSQTRYSPPSPRDNGYPLLNDPIVDLGRRERYGGDDERAFEPLWCWTLVRLRLDLFFGEEQVMVASNSYQAR